MIMGPLYQPPPSSTSSSSGRHIPVFFTWAGGRSLCHTPGGYGSQPFWVFRPPFSFGRIKKKKSRRRVFIFGGWKSHRKTHLKRSRCKREERKDERKSDRKIIRKKKWHKQEQRVPPAFGNSRNKKMRWRFNPVTKKERKRLELSLSLPPVLPKHTY